MDNLKLKIYKILYFDVKQEMIKIIEKTLLHRDYNVRIIKDDMELIDTLKTYLPDIIFISLTNNTTKEGLLLYEKIKKSIEENNENIFICIICDNSTDMDTNFIDMEYAIIRPINPIKILKKINGFIKKRKSIQKYNHQAQENFLFNLIIKSLPDIVMRIDEVGFIRYFNFPNKYKAFFNEYELLNKNLEEVVAENIASDLLSKINLSLKHKIIKIMHYDEEKIKNEIRIIPLEDESVLMIIRDITEQKLLKSMLEKFEESYTNLMQTDDHIMFRVTPELIITIANDNFKNMFDNQDIEGIHLREIFNEQNYKEMVNYFKKLNINNQTIIFEQENIINKEEKMFQYIVRSIYHEENKVISEYQIMGRDITKMLSMHTITKSNYGPKINKSEKITSALQSVSEEAVEISDEFEKLVKRINKHSLDI